MDAASNTLGALIAGAARAYGTRPALIIYDEPLSYAELEARSRALASYLRGSGLEAGERVAIWLPNSFAFVELAFACALAGLVIVPLNTRLRSNDAADALRKSRARILFVTQSFLDVDYLDIVEVMLGSGTVPELELVVNVDSDERPGIRSLSRWKADTPASGEMPVVRDAAAAAINFTSGTTSSPKGAVLSHRSLVHTARQVALRMKISPADRMISAMPFYHNGGLIPTLFSCLISGCTLYTQPRFDPDYVLYTIGKHRCTIAGGVGTMFIMMLDSPKIAGADLRSIRAVRITGPADMRKRIYERFGHPMLYSLYGMTEVTAAVTLTCPGDSMDEQLNTNGKLLPGAGIRIVDTQGDEQAVGTQGEIQIGGRSLMQGYFGDPDATASVMTADGWMRSGDLGFMDERGNLVLLGRLKDMYRSGGENVACAEVEEFLRSHPAVLHAAVLGVPDARLEEVGIAFVELRPGQQLLAEELQAFCRSRLANFKVPRYVRFRHGLPLTVSGRVEKHKLKDEALVAANGAGQTSVETGRMARSKSR